MKLLEDMRQATRSGTVYCTNCGTANPVGKRECSNCDFPLEMPTTLLGNLLGALAWPQRGLRKIVATAPVIQAFLVVLAMSALVLFVQILGVLVQLQNYLNNLGQLRSDIAPELYLRNLLRTPLQKLGIPNVPTTTVTELFGNNPAPDVSLIIFTFIQAIVTWFLFAGVIYLLTRTLYRKEAVRNFVGLLALVGFGRISWLGLLIALPIFSASGSADIAQILLLLVAVWQLGLLIVGVKFGLKMSWNHALVAVMLPAVVVIFLLGGVYSLIQIA